jgi:hypothetical protein
LTDAQTGTVSLIWGSDGEDVGAGEDSEDGGTTRPADEAGGTVDVGGGRETVTSVLCSSTSAESMSTSVSTVVWAREKSGPWSRALFPAGDEEDFEGTSGAGLRTCDAMLQSSAEADGGAFEGVADDDGKEEGADAWAVGSPGAPTRRGMLHLYE